MNTSPPSNDGPNPVLAGFGMGVLLLAFTLCTAGMWFLPTITENFDLGLGAAPGQRWSPPTATPAPTATPIPSTATPGAAPEQQQTFQIGDRAENVNDGPVNLRLTPGYLDKPSGDRIGLVPPGEQVEILGGPEAADELTWWYVNWKGKEGWMAELRASGIRILQRIDSP